MKIKQEKHNHRCRQKNNLYNQAVWRDIVEDFLEIHYSFTSQQRHLLIERFEKNGFPFEPLMQHTVLSIGNKTVICQQQTGCCELWIINYDGDLTRLDLPEASAARLTLL